VFSISDSVVFYFILLRDCLYNRKSNAYDIIYNLFNLIYAMLSSLLIEYASVHIFCLNNLRIVMLQCRQNAFQQGIYA
jgi:hypothetical protein